MSTRVSISGFWGLESRVDSNLASNRRAPFEQPRLIRFESLRDKHFDIISSSSDEESDDEFDETQDEDLLFGSSSSGAQSRLEASGIDSNKKIQPQQQQQQPQSGKQLLFQEHVSSAATRPIQILPKAAADSQAAAEMKRNLEQKSKARAVEESREQAWERRRMIEALKSSLGRSKSDCGSSTITMEEEEIHQVGFRGARSLTQEDFEELRGCIDLGFRFAQEDPQLCNTLPALEVCYAVNRQFQDLRQHGSSASSSHSNSPTAPSWSISSPGEEVHQVKEKLKQWARAVACISRQSC